uniref:Uncharacterized protein n=1 Tax=Glossina pallidipes TaxID=7398 RepID=A0A1A9ZVZ9_GLOPL
MVKILLMVLRFCITEAEKYSGKDYVRKENNGEKKQDAWMDIVYNLNFQQEILFHALHLHLIEKENLLTILYHQVLLAIVIKETKIQQDNIKQKIQSELSKPLGINIKTENIVRRTLVGSRALLEDYLQISKNVESVVTNTIGSLENPKFSNDNYIMQQQNELTAIATIKTEPGIV